MHTKPLSPQGSRTRGPSLGGLELPPEQERRERLGRGWGWLWNFSPSAHIASPGQEGFLVAMFLPHDLLEVRFLAWAPRRAHLWRAVVTTDATGTIAQGQPGHPSPLSSEPGFE